LSKNNRHAAGSRVIGKDELLLLYVSMARIDFAKAMLIIELTATGIDPA
jgi:hypothetical protein